jgi:hypothetical protein
LNLKNAPVMPGRLLLVEQASACLVSFGQWKNSSAPWNSEHACMRISRVNPRFSKPNSLRKKSTPSFRGAFFAEESLFSLSLNRRGIPHFVRNDEKFFSQPVLLGGVEIMQVILCSICARRRTAVDDFSLHRPYDASRAYFSE